MRELVLYVFVGKIAMWCPEDSILQISLKQICFNHCVYSQSATIPDKLDNPQINGEGKVWE